jgi:hypothetical protein
MQHPGQLDRAHRPRELRPYREWRVLDVGDPDELGLGAAATQIAWARSVRSIRRATIACSSR